MTPEEIIESIEAVGGLLALEGEQIYYELPTAAATLLGDLQRHRTAVVEVLRSRHLVPRCLKAFVSPDGSPSPLRSF